MSQVAEGALSSPKVPRTQLRTEGKAKPLKRQKWRPGRSARRPKLFPQKGHCFQPRGHLFSLTPLTVTRAFLDHMEQLSPAKTDHQAC